MRLNGRGTDRGRADRALLGICGVVQPEDWRTRGAALAALTEPDWRRVFAQATHHGLAGLVSRNLEWQTAVAVPPAISDALATRRLQVLAQNLARRAAARRAADALASRGIPFVALKGVALAEEAYGDLGLRACNDFDVLVPRESVEGAYAVAVELGYVLTRLTHVRDFVRAGSHAAGMTARDGSCLDIHWTIGPDLPARAVELVWKHAVAAPAGAGLPGLRLPPELALIHLAKHFHANQYRMLKPLVDFHFVHRTAAALDDGLVTTLARSMGLESLVDTAAVLRARALDAPREWLPHGGKPAWSARLARVIVTDDLLVSSAERPRIGNWLRYLAAAGGARFTARGVRKGLLPAPLVLEQFFNEPYRARMYPRYYWEHFLKVFTLSKG